MSSGAGFRAVRRHSRKRPILIDHNQDTLHTHTLELTTSGSQLGEKGDARYTSKVRVRHPPLALHIHQHGARLPKPPPVAWALGGLHGASG